MQLLMRSAMHWTVAGMLAVGLSACDDDDIVGPGANVEGRWNLSVDVRNAALNATCLGSGVIDVSQAGSAFEGEISGSALSCTGLFGLIEGDLDGPFTGGQVRGNRVTYSDGICSYDGTASGTPADRISGTTTCMVPVNAQIVLFTGTFVATR